MKKMWICFISIFLIFSSLSCKKQNQPAPPQTRDTATVPPPPKDTLVVQQKVDIYLCGDVTKSGGITTAVYWKNDSIIYLGNGSRFSTAESIFVDSNDVYVAGYEENSSSNFVAVYWKNGAKVTLGNGVKYTFAYDIKEKNDTVYTAGMQYTSTGEAATLWINGMQTTLPSNSAHSKLNTVALKGNDIYTGGYEEFGNFSYAATVWKNSISQSLSSGQTQREILSISIPDNNDIYSLGYEIINSNTGEKQIKLWKNSNSLVFVGASLFYSSSVRVIGNDIYIPGYQSVNNKYYAKYFKNGVEILLSDEGRNAYALDMSVKYNKTIVTGCLTNINNYPVAVYWQDGKLVKLDSGFISSQVKKVFLK